MQQGKYTDLQGFLLPHIKNQFTDVTSADLPYVVVEKRTTTSPLRNALLSQGWEVRNASLTFILYNCTSWVNPSDTVYCCFSALPVHVRQAVSSGAFWTEKEVVKPSREAKKSSLQPFGRGPDVGWCTLPRVIIIWGGGWTEQKGKQMVSEAAESG